MLYPQRQVRGKGFLSSSFRYRKLALKNHPLKSSEPTAPEIFKQIAEAYDVLSDREWWWATPPLRPFLKHLDCQVFCRVESKKPSSLPASRQTKGKPGGYKLYKVSISLLSSTGYF